MKKRAVLLAVSIFFTAAEASYAQTHAASGILLRSDYAHKSLVISCDRIPNYVGAMEMAFAVRDSRPLVTLTAGARDASYSLRAVSWCW